MKITVDDARSLAQVLGEGADAAEAAGETEFDLGDSFKGQAQASLDALQEAINAK